MNLKVSIPSNQYDITVGQKQQIDAILSDDNVSNLSKDNEVLRVVLGIDNVEDIAVKDRNDIISNIVDALGTEGEFRNRFTLEGIEFGMIPNYDSISNGEYLDLINYCNDDEDLHKFLAVCFRPIKKKDLLGNYSIVKYKSSEIHSEKMKELPFSIAKGLKGFFLTLCNDLERISLRYMQEEQPKE